MFMSSLQQIVRRDGPLDYKRAARYVEEVARQLADVHRRGQLHRDIRPGRVFLDEADTARLELAVWNLEDDDYEAMGVDAEIAEEIADYVAPERALASMTADERADIYSLGCVFYFLLVGRAPFSTGSIAERLLGHQIGTPDAICELRPSVPKRLAQIGEKMMAKQPRDRYQSAVEVLDALASWRNSNG